MNPHLRLLAGLVALQLSTTSTATGQGDLPPPVDSIVARHVEARGGIDAIRAIRTLEYSHGRYREGDFVGSGNARMAFRRPYYRVVGNPDDLTGFMEGFDGGAWEWHPSPGIVVRTVGPASGATRRGADFEGRLIDYRAKGSTVTLAGVERIDDRPAYRLLLTTRDGFRREYFVDAETWLIVAERYAAPVHAFGEEVSSETRIGDYRRVAGVLFPHRYRETELGTGRMLNEMQWGSVRANVALPESHFSPPTVEKTPLQKMLESLFASRTDVEATLWAYDAFRRGYPNVATREGVEMVGYQMLKMGDALDTAIRLLERNADDHPGSASAAFSLGRALETAGFPGSAAIAYRRALSLDPAHAASLQAIQRVSPP